VSRRRARPPDWESVWPAPAKLNLFLHILGRRPDGYHEVQTALQFLDRYDELAFAPRDDGRICRPSGPAGVPEAADLTVRAATLLQAETGSRQGVEIRIRKRIPVGGGLGGGSSDAATTLHALNRLWALNLPDEALLSLGRRLGADVPVFVLGRAAWAEGIGDRLTPVDFPEPVYLVVAPDCSVATVDVFQAAGLTRNSAPITISSFLAYGAGNDCTGWVRTAYPEVGRALDWLGRFGEARLTGTGACVYAAFDDPGAARGVLEEVPAAWSAFVARGCNRSPLLGSIGSRDRAAVTGRSG
jgi:4-diphosphocytidyl-2-C-methyl-D-erythritol kinase